MRTTTSFDAGDIVRPMPKQMTVKGENLILPDDAVIRHDTEFNVIIISHFLVAVKPIQCGEEVLLNFNTAFFDLLNPASESQVNESPIVSGFRYLSSEEKEELYAFADEGVRHEAISNGFTPGSAERGVRVRRAQGELFTVSDGSHESGSEVFSSTGVLLPFPVRSTVEVPGDKHLRLTGGAEFLYHSCLPNLKLEIRGTEIVGIALRPIEDGEALTFNYLCTEWEITKVFHCACNVYCCYGIIKGFKYLDAEQQNHLLADCSDAVKEKYRSHFSPKPKAALSVPHNASLTTSSTGLLASQRHIAAGTVLFRLSKEPRAEKGVAILDQLRVPHGCDANIVVVDGRVVTSRALVPGDLLTCNTSLFQYEDSSGFSCDCGSSQCAKTVKGFRFLSDEEKKKVWIFVSPAVRKAALDNGFQVPSCSDQVDVRLTSHMGHALFASGPIAAGAHIFNMKGLVLPFPTVYTIFLGEDKHLLFGGGAQCLAHSCTPNTRIVVDPANGCFDCFSLRSIAKDEVISFNYLTTEWDMAEPFPCSCGSGDKCFRVIEGFRHLSKEHQLSLWETATKAVRSRYAQTQRSGAATLAQLDPQLVAASGKNGELVLQRDLPSGTVLFRSAGAFDIHDGKVQFGDVLISHSCDPSAALLDTAIVLCKAALRGTPVTVNINQLVYAANIPYSCHCGAAQCCGTVKGFRFLDVEQQNVQLLCALPDLRAEAVAQGYINKSSSPLVEIRANGGMGQATFATKPIPSGTRFFQVSGLVIPFPTVYTIMLEPGRHLLFAGGAQCLAHSCNPNVRVIVDSERRTIECQALRDIAEGDLISFNYLTTEWDMNTPFKCICGAANCFRDVKGFLHLTDKNRQMLWSMTTPAIRTLAASSANWRKLTEVALCTDTQGRILAGTVLHQGTPILDASSVKVKPGQVTVDGVSLNHNCNPTACVIGRRVVLLQTICAGTEITVDMNLIEYEMVDSFECSCGTHAPRRISGFKCLSPKEQSERIIFARDLVVSDALKSGYRPQLDYPLLHIRPNGKMGCVSFAAEKIRAGTRFLKAQGLRVSFPTTYTIMLDEGEHLLFGGGVQYLAHSCEPNVRICIDEVNNTVECEALRDILPDELIGYNYNSTEWDMASPFTCLCGKPACALSIRGYKHLTSAQRAALQPLITPAIRELAGMYSDVQLPSTIGKRDDGRLFAKSYIAKERVVLEVFFLDIQPSQICVGRDYTIPHSNDYNCVYVEGRIVSCKAIQPDEALTVNLNYFVYDMTQLFPKAFSEECKGFKYMDEKLKQEFLYLCEPPVRRQAMLDGWIVTSSQTALAIKPNGDMGQTAYATRDIEPGTTLFHCTGLLVPFPTMYTICVGEQQHLLFGDAAECIAHHCDPNVRVKVNGDGTFDFVSVKPIKTGDMVTFNYNTTEWHMNTPFSCLCGSEFCAGMVCGFRSLTAADRQRLWPITSEIVKARCKE